MPIDNLTPSKLPLGVAEFTYLQKLLEEFKRTRPTMMEIEGGLWRSRRTPLKSDCPNKSHLKSLLPKGARRYSSRRTSSGF